MMFPLSRRAFLGAAVSAGLAGAASPRKVSGDLRQQLLEEAVKLQAQRRARFAAVRTKQDLEALQKELRRSFLALLDGLPTATGVPPVKKTGTIEADGYRIDKLVYESFPGYFVSALLYVPDKLDGAAPGILSPCGHSTTGKAAGSYQTLHMNLAKRGCVVLTYDPVGQGERSQFWNEERGRSRYNLTCGEHAVLGNPLYLLGTSLARYRIWDGIRGLDYLASLPEVDARRLGCVGNSGGGTLTAYIAALDERVHTAVISCYITTLPRRMANRIERDPDSDPEQDIFGFVSAGIDHAGLLALRAPRPTLLNTAQFDFFPIEGARESFAEAKHLYEVAGVGGQVHKVEAAEKHGLTKPLRDAAYAWFDRWLTPPRERRREQEIDAPLRPTKDLLVCADGQVNTTFRSRPLLPLALKEFQNREPAKRLSLRDMLRLDQEAADVRLTELAAPKEKTSFHLLCINGVEAGDWGDEAGFLRAVAQRGVGVTLVEPRGVGESKLSAKVGGHTYADALCGVEENLAYNAFLVGKTLLGMRVTDVLEAVARVRGERKDVRIVLCGRRDAALVACFAAAVETSIVRLAVEEMPLSFWPLFEAKGKTINAASVLPGLLCHYGDLPAVLGSMERRPVLAAAPEQPLSERLTNMTVRARRFSREPGLLLDWLGV